MQRTLIDFFNSSTNGKPQSSDESESSDECSEIFFDNKKDLRYYQNLLQKNNNCRQAAKILVNNGGAECWKYFGNLQISNKVVLEKLKFCEICFNNSPNFILKGFGLRTSTTNYTNHLKVCHGLDIKKQNFNKTKDLTAKSLSSTTKNKFAHARRLAEMCCIDLQPFSTCQRLGFQKYVKHLDPNITFPSATTVATGALNDVYDVYLSSIKKLTSSCPNNINIVLDMWTDKYKKISYINIKIHYSVNFDLKCISLKTEHFPHPHTGRAVADKVIETIEFFGLQNKKMKAVTDGGSNIVSAMKIKNIERLNCIAHSLHRFITYDILCNDAFEDLNNIILKIKQIYRTLTYRREDILEIQQLKENEKIFEILQNLQNITNCIDCDDNIVFGEMELQLEAAIKNPRLPSLKNSVETRWNSILSMLKSFSQNCEVINIVLLKMKRELLLIPSMEHELIKEFVEFLEIFSEATTYMQGQKYATISCVIYFHENIMSKFINQEGKSSFGIMINLYIFAKQHFSERFKILKVHLIAALLDPCQKNWSTLNKYVKKIPSQNVPDTFVLENEFENHLSKEILLYREIKNQDIGVDVYEEPPAKKEIVSKTRKSMLNFLHDTGEPVNKDPILIEIQKYMDIPVHEVEGIEWWKENEKLFPRISILANIYFGIPATSASSEIAFSMAGSCITEKRSRLNPSTVMKQLFVHDNFNIINDNT